MNEMQITTLAFYGFWLLVAGVILLLGKSSARLSAFRQQMLNHWKPALAISLIFLLGTALGGRSVLNPIVLGIFSQVMLGLALMDGVQGCDPLPVSHAISRRRGILRVSLYTLLAALLAAVIAVVIGNIGLSVVQQVFHENSQSQAALSGFAPTSWQAFWLFLSGAGIAEETTFRLLAVALLWRLFRRPSLAVILAAGLFGAYHLTPLSGMYRTFLQYPVSQFIASVLIGLVWGWLFVKRGYETSVLAHTLSNWLPMLVFR